MGKTPFQRILVTGGAGYVGSVLVPVLLEAGYRVRVLDILRHNRQGLLPIIGHKNLEFIKGDIRSKEDVAKAAQGIDVIIHLAAIVGYPACRKEPELSREINVEGTRRIVEAANGKTPIFFASTGSAYGELIEKICTETTPLNPLSDYGKQKAEAEEIVRANKTFVIYRFATAFGVSPRMRLDVLPNDFTYRAAREKTLIVYEKHFVRPFIHVKDMARAFLFALDHYDAMRGEIYNVGNSKLHCSKEELCRIIKNKIDFYLHFADVGHDVEARNYTVSYDKIEKLGFATAVSMEEGIEELVRASQLIDMSNIYYDG